MFGEMNDEEFLKFRFGMLFDNLDILNATFDLMEKDLKIDSIVDMDFDENEEDCLIKLVVTDNNEYLRIRVQFKHPDDETVKREVLRANEIFEKFEGTDKEKPVKSLIVLIDDPVLERVRKFYLTNNSFREMEFCSFKDIDGDKHMARINDKLGRN